MADEGGAAAATIEATPARRRARYGRPVFLALGSAVLALLAVGKLARGRR